MLHDIVYEAILRQYHVHLLILDPASGISNHLLIDLLVPLSWDHQVIV